MDRAWELLARLARLVRANFSSTVTGSAMATVAFCSGFISYTHICALTLSDHGSWKVAHLMPLPVDGQIIIGSSYFLDGKTRWQKAAGLLLGVLPGIGESLWANWQSGAEFGFRSQLWDTVPAQAFACSMFLFERWLHNRKLARIAAGELRTEQELAIAGLQEEMAGTAAAHERELAGARLAHEELAGQLTAAQATVAGAGEANTALHGQVRELTARVSELQSLLARRKPARQPAAPGAAAGPEQEAALAAAPARSAHPAPAGNDLPPLPLGGELAELLLKMPANIMARNYDIGRWLANKVKQDFIAGVRVIGPDGRLEWATAQETNDEEAETDAA